MFLGAALDIVGTGFDRGLARAALGWVRELERLPVHDLAEWEELVGASQDLDAADVELEQLEQQRVAGMS